jgi:16S rRNA G966 N2-methylase RsmD
MGSQLSLLDSPVARAAFRPIHYLGSKLRLLPQILDAIDSVAPRGLICDLFAGSGTVSRGAAATHSVISVDIQEYSRVLCSAVLNPVADAGVRSGLAPRGQSSELYRRLSSCFTHLLEYEALALAAAERGDARHLWDLIEHGSLVRASASTFSNGPLRELVLHTIERLQLEQLWGMPAGVISSQFGGPFFAYSQAIAFDALLSTIHGVSAEERDAALAPLLSTASSLVNTVGKQFAQPLKPRDRDGATKAHLIAKALRDRRASVWDTYRYWVSQYASLPPTAGPAYAVRADYRAFLADCQDRVVAFYADPPYTRDHYSRYYHVLETMCLRDRPAISTTRIRTGGEDLPSRGVYRVDRHQSPFCVKSQAPAAFEALFNGVRQRNSALVLSYSPSRDVKGGDLGGAGRSRVMRTGDIVAAARRHFRDVQVKDAYGVVHSKLNRRSLSTGTVARAEILISCRP